MSAALNTMNVPEQQQLAMRESDVVQQAPSLYQIFAAMAKDNSIEPARIAQLMELHERAEKREAEKAFIAAFARLNFPPIRKTSKAHNSKYAAWDNVQEIITPILAAEGFTLSFTSGEVTPQGIPIHGTLSHIQGHSRPGLLYLPRDKSGSMNEIQGVGSTTSYGERYLAKMMLNLRFIGDDDDGNATSAISRDQQDNIEALITECGLSSEARSKFMEFMGVKAISDIQQGGYKAAINFLVAKRRKVEERAQ